MSDNGEAKSRMVPIVNQIDAAVRAVPGWSPVDQLLALFTLVMSGNDVNGDILELGSWCGRSAIALGMAARICGRTRVHCVDLFPEEHDWYKNADGTYSFSVSLGGKVFEGSREQAIWEEPYLRDIVPVYRKFKGTFEAFNDAMQKSNLSDVVTPFRGDIESFLDARSHPLRVRLAFIDGDHGYLSVCKDIEAIERVLVPGGWICFDDAFSHYDGVDRAVKDMVIKSGKYSHCQQLTRKLFVARRL